VIHTCTGNDCLHISPRQIEVLKLVARGKTNPEIAQLTGRSVQTVKNALVPLFDELGASSRTGLAFAAVKAGLLSMDDL